MLGPRQVNAETAISEQIMFLGPGQSSLDPALRRAALAGSWDCPPVTMHAMAFLRL